MNKDHKKDKRLKNRPGVTAVVVAVAMIALLGIAALAIDVGHMAVVKNELQNAADAAALAGARVLYKEDGTDAVNWDGYTHPDTMQFVPNANQRAYDTAVLNKSQKTAAEVLWTSGNTGDIQRGHWSFGLGSLARGFYPRDETAPTDLEGKSNVDLDEEATFINAVRVVTRRQSSPVLTFFAGVLGMDPIVIQAEAVAYIGFVGGTINPGEVDAPIAICSDTLLDASGRYSCNIGRMINSGSTDGTNDTARWTNFEYNEDCLGGSTVNDNELRSLISCTGQANPLEIIIGQGITTNNGEMNNAIADMEDCFSDKHPYLWNMTLPVIICDSDPNCGIVIGVVNVNIVHIEMKGNDVADVPMVKKGSYIDSVDGSEVQTNFSDWPTAAELAEPLTSGGDESVYTIMGQVDFLSNLITGKLVVAYGANWMDRPLGDFFPADPWNPTDKKDHNADYEGAIRWASFVKHFHLKNVDEGGTRVPAPFAFKSIYFLPDCTESIGVGRTGQGANFGVLAKIPVLVD